MKKITIALVAVLSAILMCIGLVACGSGTKYNYTETTVEGDSSVTSIFSSMTSMYDTLYKDSYIEVGSKEIKWTIQGEKSSMTYEKDGDKYVLGGDFTKQLKEGMSSFGADIEISLYGLEVEDGFQIVMEEEVMEMTVKIIYNFKKA